MKETIEEFAEKLARAFDNDNYKALMDLVIEGAKWQQERMYSEEEVLVMLSEVRKGSMVTSSTNNRTYWDFDIKSEKKWFEQFKKK